MAASAVLAFWAVALLLIVVPGPDWAFILGAGRAVVPAVGGLVAGYLVLTAAVAAGVGALVAGSPVILTALTVVGGAVPRVARGSRSPDDRRPSCRRRRRRAVCSAGASG